MNGFFVFVGIILVVSGCVMYLWYKDVPEDELVEKSPGAHYEAWNLSVKAVIILLLGLLFLLMGLAS